MNKSRKEEIILELFEKDVIQFGEFKLKSGKISPYYFDFRLVFARHPKLLRKITQEMIASSSYLGVEGRNDLICGLPYGAISLAVIASQELDRGYLLLRKEQKEYGTKKMIEGEYKFMDSVVLFDDVITSGITVKESVDKFVKVGLVVREVLVILDRQEGANLEVGNQFKIKPLLTISEVIEVLEKHNQLDSSAIQKIRLYLTTNISNKYLNKEKDKSLLQITKSLSRIENSLGVVQNEIKSKDLIRQVVPDFQPAFFSEKAYSREFLNPKSEWIWKKVLERKSNLILACDFKNTRTIINMANLLGSEILGLKIHVDLITDFSLDFIMLLRKMANHMGFLLFEDRKLADIGKIAYQQMTEGTFQISSWADLVTLHSQNWVGLNKYLDQKEQSEILRLPSFLLIEQMSSDDFIPTVESISEDLIFNKRLVGLITQNSQYQRNDVLKITPGVKLERSKVGDQNYRSVQEAILDQGNDIIIVGSGILDYRGDVHKKDLCRAYRTIGWESLLKKWK